MYDSSNRKVFVIGFNKCGTSSLNYFFNKNGLKSLHYDGGNLAVNIERNVRQFKNPIEGYEKYRCFLDMECVNSREFPLVEAYKFYREIYRWNPGSKFILNTRDVDKWVRSRASHSNGRYLDWYKYHYGINNSERIKEIWKIDFYQHHANVLRFFQDKPNELLVYNIEKDSPERISDFLSDIHQFNDLEMPRSNATKKYENEDQDS